MKKEHLLNAISLCDQGILRFNRGEIRAFLYKRHWYPLRAVVNAGLKQKALDENTTDRALVALGLLMRYIRIAKIRFDDKFPVKLSESGLKEEISYLEKEIENLR